MSLARRRRRGGHIVLLVVLLPSTQKSGNIGPMGRDTVLLSSLDHDKHHFNLSARQPYETTTCTSANRATFSPLRAYLLLFSISPWACGTLLAGNTVASRVILHTATHNCYVGRIFKIRAEEIHISGQDCCLCAGLLSYRTLLVDPAVFSRSHRK